MDMTCYQAWRVLAWYEWNVACIMEGLSQHMHPEELEDTFEDDKVRNEMR